jgi:hypothetical protein
MKSILFSLFLLGFSVFGYSQTYTEDIANIIYNHCSTCHRPGEIGPQSFTNYEEVRNWAQTIKFVTSTRYMPPWQADPNYAHFLEENYLQDEEIDLIAAWVDAGAPQGPASAEPPFPQFPTGSLLGEPDLVLSFSQEHVHLGNNMDEYRYFVLPTGLTEDKIIKAIEFRPGNSKIVHHALMFEDLTGQAAASDAQTPEYGFEGFGGFGTDNSDWAILGQKQYPGYVPGQKPIRFPDGMGQTIGAGADLVVQVHYAPWSTNESDLSSINIFFADENESVDRFVRDSIMLPFNIAPGGFFGFVNFRLEPEEIETFHGTWELEEDLSFMGISPHMHLLGIDCEVFIEHTDGSITNLIKIPEWDFNWQGNYYFPKLLTAEQGSIVHAFATYDNSSENPNNPTIPPKAVIWGERTTDEMFYLPLLHVPYRNGDENIIFDATLSDDNIEAAAQNVLKPLYPNPVKDFVNIEFELGVGSTVSIELIDVNGSKIRTLRNNEYFGTGEKSISLRTDNLASGTYFIKLDNNGQSYVQKFIKI